MIGFFKADEILAIHMTRKTDKNEIAKNRNQFRIMSH
jgi:hypothetical protein